MKQPFKKWRVLKYEPAEFLAFTYEPVVYNVTVEVHSWWGLRKRIKKAKYELDHTQHDFEKTLAKWEEQKTWSNELAQSTKSK